MNIHIIYASSPVQAYTDYDDAKKEYERLRDLDDLVNYSLISMPLTPCDRMAQAGDGQD